MKVKTIYTENIEAIEYEDYTESKICFRTSDAKIINQIVKSINEANIEGPYKGCCWNKIKIIYGDSTIKLFTDGIVFSDVGSGTFYKFNKPFFENLMRE